MRSMDKENFLLSHAPLWSRLTPFFWVCNTLTFVFKRSSQRFARRAAITNGSYRTNRTIGDQFFQLWKLIIIDRIEIVVDVTKQTIPIPDQFIVVLSLFVEMHGGRTKTHETQTSVGTAPKPPSTPKAYTYRFQKTKNLQRWTNSRFSNCPISMGTKPLRSLLASHYELQRKEMTHPWDKAPNVACQGRCYNAYAPLWPWTKNQATKSTKTTHTKL